ncbi:MAG TPA: hypothetical protein VN842_02915 [Thermoplasmata archaeon]|nr:hypothetical protein [Thermoplasmata archaeon]
MAAVPRFDPVGLLTLREIRTFIRRSSARGGVVFFGLLYVLGSLFLGGMVVLGDIRGGYSFFTVWGGTAGSWNYPGLLVVAPWGVVSLPFFATFAMIVVGIGVGYGMTVAFLLAVRLVRPQRGRGPSTAVGALAGLTPAMISLVTLGACCSTTAAATAGVGLVAQASGTSASNLLLNNWYLGVFQIVLVWVALLAQEMLLVVYAGLFGRADGGGEGVGDPASRRVDGRFLVGGVLRVLLLGAGVVWALAVLAEWTTINPSTAGAGYWFQWVVQHELVAGLAIAAALFPTATYAAMHRTRQGLGWVVPGVILLAGLLLVLWVPPPLPAWGVDSLVNQILAAAGAPASWGATGTGSVGGVALYLRWAFEYILLGGFAVAVSMAPDRAFSWLAPSTTAATSASVTSVGLAGEPTPAHHAVNPPTSSAPHLESP